MAAGCLWVICQELSPDGSWIVGGAQPDITLERISTTTGISKPTIRDVVKTMGGAERLSLLLVFALGNVLSTPLEKAPVLTGCTHRRADALCFRHERHERHHKSAD